MNRAGVEGTEIGAIEHSPWRDLFPITERWLFLDHAGVAPISTRVQAAIAGFAAEAVGEFPLRYPYWEERAEEVRRACARLVGCEARQVAFVKNTSEGLSLVAEGLDWRPGDAVVIADREFPSNVYPWRALERLGVEIRMLDPGPEGLTAGQVGQAMDGRVRVVALSAVAYGTGDGLDLEGVARACRAHGAYFVVDAIQAVGAVPLDLHRAGLDCVTADGHKWLCAPEGCGILAVSDRLLDRLRPAQLGWKSVMESGNFYPYDFRLRNDAAKLEAGSLNLLGIHALGAAVDLALEIGVARIGERLAALTDAITSGLEARGRTILGARGSRDGGSRDSAASFRSGIVTFVPKGPPERVRQELWARRVVTKVRFGGIRVSPHHYQDSRDVEQFLSRLDESEAALA